MLDGYCLDRASDKQIEEIDADLRKYSELLPFPPYRQNHWMENTAQGGMYQIRDLDPHDWRYFVINFNDDGLFLSGIEYAFNLSNAEIQVAWMVIKVPNGPFRAVGRWPVKLANVLFPFGPLSRRHPIDLTAADLTEIRELISIVRENIPMRQQLRDDLSEFENTKVLPPDSLFRFVAYCTLIERIITHDPNGNQDDSEKRQVAAKMLCLSKRHRVELPYEESFGNGDPGSVWSAVYRLRNDIAHGIAPKFDAGELVNLRNYDSAIGFVHESTKRLLRFALMNADEMAGLKKMTARQARDQIPPLQGSN